jgi:anti-sigma factor RsiW
VKQRLERKLWIYSDGELSPQAQERMKRRLEADAESRARLHQMETLGQVIRESWTEGPQAPAPGLVINALRPELARVDEERADRSPWRRLREHLGDTLKPAPVRALAGSVAAVILAVVIGSPLLNGGDALDHSLPSVRWPTTIYSIGQGDKPLMVYEVANGMTVIWVVEDQNEDRFSGRLPRGDRWV